MARPGASRSLAEDTAANGTALLIIDMISTWDFPDAEKLLPGAWRITAAIARLKRRCAAAGIPVIYANDNRGRWRSDFAAQVRQSIECGGRGAAITQALMPGDGDYFVLKPSQSAFFATPLALLLRHLEAERIVLAGVASDQCILSTAVGARMQSLEVLVPRDCVATQGAARHRAVLRQFEQVHRLATTESPHVQLYAAKKRRRR